MNQRFVAPTIIGIVALFGSACVSTGEVREVVRPASMATYPKALVTVRAADPSMKNVALRVEACQSEIPAALVEQKVFSQIVDANASEQADVWIEADIVAGDRSYTAAGIIREDEAVELEVKFVDPKSKASMGVLNVTGNSKSNVQTGIGNVSVANFSDLIKKACREAGGHLATYLAENKPAS